MAMMHTFGPPSLFVTVSPCHHDATLMLKISGLADGGRFQRSFTLPSLASRRRMLTENPVASAVVYRTLINAFYEELFGLPLEHNRKKSHPPVAQRQKGIFGTPIAGMGVTEMQGRKSPHGHSLLWHEVTALTIQDALSSKQCCDLICRRLDSMICALLPLGPDGPVTPNSDFPCDEPSCASRWSCFTSDSH